MTMNNVEPPPSADAFPAQGLPARWSKVLMRALRPVLRPSRPRSLQRRIPGGDLVPRPSLRGRGRPKNPPPRTSYAEGFQALCLDGPLNLQNLPRDPRSTRAGVEGSCVDILELVATPRYSLSSLPDLVGTAWPRHAQGLARPALCSCRTVAFLMASTAQNRTDPPQASITSPAWAVLHHLRRVLVADPHHRRPRPPHPDPRRRPPAPSPREKSLRRPYLMDRLHAG